MAYMFLVPMDLRDQISAVRNNSVWDFTELNFLFSYILNSTFYVKYF